ncbi:MAG: PAS domain-containing protein [Parvibaculum sp.]
MTQTAPPRGDECFGSIEYIRTGLQSELLVKVLDYWDEIRGDKAFPSRAQFNPMRIPKALPSLFLVDVLPDDVFRYRLAGSVVEEFYGQGKFAGSTPQEKFGDSAERALIPYRRVRDTHELFLRSANLSWVHEDRKYFSYTVIILPLGEDGTTVNMLLGTHDFVRER